MSQSRETLKLKNDLLAIGTGGFNNPWDKHNSASRKQMANQHAQQACPLPLSELPRIMTGMEKQMGEYTQGVTIEEDCIVIAVLNKYRAGLGKNNVRGNSLITLIVQLQACGTYDIINIETYSTTQEVFGLEFEILPIVQQLRPGFPLAKGTELSRSPSIKEGGMYGTGINLNTLYCTLPACIEDGFLISDEVAERAAPYYIIKRKVNWGAKSFPVNIYGDKDNYKPHPGIGECVRDDGLLFATRATDPLFEALDMHPDNLMRPDFVHDDRAFAPAGAKVLDIVVHSTVDDRKGKPSTPMNMELFTKIYSDKASDYYKSLLTFYDNLKRKEPRHRLTPKLQRAIVEAIGDRPNDAETRKKIGTGNGDRSSLISKTYKMSKLDEWTVEITLGYSKPLKNGAKLTTRHGAKGVVCAIAPKEQMPIDEYGNRVDVVAFGKSVIARLNPGQLYEQYVNAASRDVANDIRAFLHNGEVDAAWNHLMGYYEIVSPSILQVCQNFNSQEEQLSHLRAIDESGIYLHIRPDSDSDNVELYKRLRAYRRPNKGKLTLRTFAGGWEKTKSEMLIGSEEFLVLEKTYHSPFAVGTSRRQNYGLPACNNKTTKHSTPVVQASPRWLGETEVRGISANIGGEYVANLIDYTTNPESSRSVVRTISEAEYPSNIDEAVDRNEIPMGGCRAHAFVEMVLNVAGIQMSNSDVDI